MELKHEHHFKRSLNKNVPFGVTVTDTSKCPLCNEQRREKEETDRAFEESRFAAAQPLECDKCGAHLGFVYEMDLNGSRFYCDNCKNKKQ